MTYPDFLSLLERLKIDTNPYLPFSIDRLFRYSGGRRSKFWTKPKDVPVPEPIIIMFWETGGISGGSCWDESDPQPYSLRGSAPDTFEDLDKILMEVAPQMTHFQFIALNKMVEDGSEVDYQYYGNCTEYAYRLITVRALHDELIKMGLISAD